MSDSSAPASAFSAPDAAIITHQPRLDESLLASTSARSGRSLEELYDIKATAQKLVDGRFQRVALQFPDEGLPDSVPIYWALKAEIDAAWEVAEVETKVPDATGAPEGVNGAGPALGKPDLFILADTSYGNCCVDEVAAQHIDADVVVHYGHACLSPTARLPVIYVFPKRPINTAQAASALASSAFELLTSGAKDIDPRKAILLAYDVGYAHAAEEVFRSVQENLAALASGADESISLPPLALTQLDVAKNFEERIAEQKARREAEATGKGPAEALKPDSQRAQGACCGTNGATSSCVAPEVTPSTAKSGSGCADTGSNGCGCGPSKPGKIVPSAEGKEDVVDAAVSGGGSGRLYNLPSGCTLSDTLILYLGGESLALTNLLLRAGPACPVITCDPQAHLETTSKPAEKETPDSQSITPPSTRREDGKTNRLLMRRYAAVQRARDASVVGLLVGTLGVRSYLPLLSHLRRLLTGRGLPGHGKDRDRSSGVGGGRKVYTISVGKLSPAKLANFQEVDVFVLLACPENSLVDAVDPGGMRSKEFYKPIVTPYEMILALDESRSWTGEYVLELGNLIEGPTESEDAPETNGADHEGGANGSTSGDAAEATSDSDSDDEPHFSLVTGTYVSRRRYLARDELLSKNGSTSKKGSHRDPDAGTVTLANGDGKSGELVHILDSASPLHLAGRSWKGLEQRVGMDPPAKLEEGRGGVARGYEGEQQD